MFLWKCGCICRRNDSLMRTEYWLNNSDKKRSWPNRSKPCSYATLSTVDCHDSERGPPLMTSRSLTTWATVWPDTMGTICMDHLLWYGKTPRFAHSMFLCISYGLPGSGWSLRPSTECNYYRLLVDAINRLTFEMETGSFLRGTNWILNTIYKNLMLQMVNLRHFYA
jgi:hypothetical protein